MPANITKQFRLDVCVAKFASLVIAKVSKLS